MLNICTCDADKEFYLSLQKISSIPPPPPPMMAPAEEAGEGGDTNTEALHSMLISWYMSGYHTGFYQVGGNISFILSKN